MDGDEYLTYDASECDISELRAEVSRLDTEISSQLTDVTPSVSETSLQSIYSAISAKYNLDIGYKDFRDFIRTVADESKLNVAMNEALGAKVVAAITQRTQLKLIISMSYLIDRSLDLIEKESRNTQILSPELVGMIDRTISWFQTLDQIKSNIDISDPDRMMEKLIEKEQGVATKTNERNTDISIIKQIAEQIKNSN